MPPKGRSSSSSRSSSNRSSSSRSSSSRSSSSRSSSYRSSSRSSYSRPSSRSSSSRYSSSNNNYYYNNSYKNSNNKFTEEKRKAQIFAKNYKRNIRSASSFITNNQFLNPTFHHCLKHDYYYFDKDFTDNLTGDSYKKGYYDETGTYYENLILDFSKMETISLYTCEHCQSSQKIDLESFQNNEILTCQNCGAVIDVNNCIPLNIDYYVCDEKENLTNASLLDNKYASSSYYNSSYNSYNNNSNQTLANNFIRLIAGIFIFVFVINIFSILMFSSVFSGVEKIFDYKDDFIYEDIDKNNDYNSYEDYYDYKIFGDKLFVSAIDRYCYFDGDYYYDEVTDCYFCYNTDITVPSMQFWFEDFSSQYGDYGWLEYHEDESSWYVEIGYNRWEKLEDVPDYFWYTTFNQLLEDNDIPEY